MPMKREDHETLLNELLLPDIETSRKTEILTQLRTDYGSIHSEFDEITKSNKKLTSDNQDLVISNSKLFRQIGLTDQGVKEEQVRSKAETITIESLEKE